MGHIGSETRSSTQHERQAESDQREETAHGGRLKAWATRQN
jgi:hypothetical protein